METAPLIRSLSPLQKWEKKIRLEISHNALLILFATMILLTACASRSIDYLIIDRGLTSGQRFPSLYFDVITEEKKFDQLFREVHSHQLPPPLPPEIDFRSSLVIFVSMGEKPTAGYRVEIDRITWSRDVLKVKVRFHEPSQGDIQATLVTHPFVMVKVKKEGNLKKVEFLDQRNQILGSISN